MELEARASTTSTGEGGTLMMDIMDEFDVSYSAAYAIAYAFVVFGILAAFAADVFGIPTGPLGSLLLANTGLATGTLALL